MDVLYCPQTVASDTQLMSCGPNMASVSVSDYLLFHSENELIHMFGTAIVNNLPESI